MGDITGDYVWHMEDVLHQYHLPYDVRHPLESVLKKGLVHLRDEYSPASVPD